MRTRQLPDLDQLSDEAVEAMMLNEKIPVSSRHAMIYQRRINRMSGDIYIRLSCLLERMREGRDARSL